MQKDLCMKDIRIGSKAEIKWTVKTKDISSFAKLSGDNNLLHMNKSLAIKKGFDVSLE